MSLPHYDASHDYAHIQRVLALALFILKVEQSENPQIPYDRTTVTLAALMHDVGDHKYTTTSTPSSPDPKSLISHRLLSFGAPPALAQNVQTIVHAVSYSSEIRNPEHVLTILAANPELAIVQDADRLDALGAVGIGRTFTYGGAKDRPRGSGMQGSVDHFEEKLVRLGTLMKTAEGVRLARERTERVRVFQRWWEEETALMVWLEGEEKNGGD
jgi:uncharacterized protein